MSLCLPQPTEKKCCWAHGANGLKPDPAASHLHASAQYQSEPQIMQGMGLGSVSLHSEPQPAEQLIG